jgi:hypothetical protein
LVAELNSVINASPSPNSSSNRLTDAVIRPCAPQLSD